MMRAHAIRPRHRAVLDRLAYAAGPVSLRSAFLPGDGLFVGEVTFEEAISLVRLETLRLVRFVPCKYTGGCWVLTREGAVAWRART